MSGYNKCIDAVGTGANLYNLRVKSGISAEELAWKLDVDRRTIYKRESGHLPNVEQLARHALIFGRSLSDVIAYNAFFQVPEIGAAKSHKLYPG